MPLSLQGILLLWLMELKPLSVFLSFLVAFTSTTVFHSFPITASPSSPLLCSHGLPSPVSQTMPAYSFLKVPGTMPAQPKAAAPIYDIFHVPNFIFVLLQPCSFLLSSLHSSLSHPHGYVLVLLDCTPLWLGARLSCSQWN